MSLLTMITQCARRIGINAPASVSSSADPAVIQLMAIANEEGQDLASRYAWQALQTQSTFSTVATESQGVMTTLAGAGFRYIVNNAMWNRTLLRPVFGPLSPGAWQELKARNVTGPYNQFRIKGNELLFIPVPAASQTIAFEWVSRNWVNVTAGGTTAAAWTADADTGVLDEEVMTAGVIWRWQQAKGLEYAENYAKYERLVSDLMARDGGKPTLNMGTDFQSWPAGVFLPLGSWSL